MIDSSRTAFQGRNDACKDTVCLLKVHAIVVFHQRVELSLHRLESGGMLLLAHGDNISRPGRIVDSFVISIRELR